MDLSKCGDLTEDGLLGALPLFPNAENLFLPPGSKPELAAKAKAARPSLKVAHLGAVVSADGLIAMEQEYKSTSGRVPRVTLPAVYERAEDIAKNAKRAKERGEAQVAVDDIMLVWHSCA